MSEMNESLFCAVLFGGLFVGTLAVAQGRSWAQGLIIVLFLYTNLSEGKVIDVFGWPTTLGTALYGVIAFVIDGLNERWGKDAANDAIRKSVVASLIFQGLLAITLMTTPITEAMPVAQAMGVVFTLSLRVTIASLFVYFFSQSLDAWLYDRLRIWTQGRHLWLRSKVSTFISQGFDSFAFAFLAFYGVYDAWFAMACVGYGFKVFVALCDTGFLYIIRALPPPSGKKGAYAANHLATGRSSE